MSLNPEHLAHARQVADAVLYEGYLLYPYHQAAQKNQVRFQFGVLMPPGYAQVDPHEPAVQQTECLLECPDSAQVRVLARFLQLQDRTVQGVSPDTGELEDVGALYVAGTEYTSWSDAAEREQQATVTVADLLAGDQDLEFHIGPGELAEDITDEADRQAGRLVRRWSALDGVIRMHAERVAGPYQALRLRLRLENTSTPRAEFAVREDGLRHAMIAAHVLIAVPGGRFLSMTDPPEWAAAEVSACENTGTWPVLAGPPDCRDLLLSSPVILYDHPEVAAESAGQLFDSTEIDEILTLRTLALTDAEKRAARATDSRVAEMMDRLDDLPPEMLDRLHGAIRYLRDAPAGARLAAAPEDGATNGARVQWRRVQWRRGRGGFTDHRPPADAVVGSRLGLDGVPRDRPRAGRRGARGPAQPSGDAAGYPAGRRPGPVPGRPRGHRGGRAARRGWPGPPGRAPGR